MSSDYFDEEDYFKKEKEENNKDEVEDFSISTEHYEKSNMRIEIVEYEIKD